MPPLTKFRAVPCSDINIRGEASPWALMHYAVAARLGAAPSQFSTSAIHLAPKDYARCTAEARLYQMRGFKPGPPCAMQRGLAPGFAYVPTSQIAEVAP